MQNQQQKYLVIPKPNMIVQESKVENVIDERLALRVVERSAENLDANCVHKRDGLGRQMCVLKYVATDKIPIKAKDTAQDNSTSLSSFHQTYH